MFESRIQAKLSLPAFISRRPMLDFVDLLFLISAPLVSLELYLAASFTVYDLITVIIAFLLFVGPRRMQFMPLRFLPAIYVFLLFALISILRASHPMEALTQTLVFAFIFFIQLPVILTLTKSQFVLRMSLLLFFVGAMIGTLWALVYQHVQGAGRVLTFYSHNPNRLGYPTAYLLPFVLYFLFDNWRRKRYLVSALLALPVFYTMFWALAASASRSSTVATVVGLLLFLVFRKGFRLDFRTPLRILSVVVVIGLVGYLLFDTSYFPATLRTRIQRTLNMEETLVDDRRRLAIAGLLAFVQSPLVGVGLENFRYVAKEYVPTATDQVPHNMWIQFLSQVGLFGTLAFLALIIGWFLMVFRAQRATTDVSLRELLSAQIASMAAVMTIYMFIPIMDQRQYWLLYGLGLAVALELRGAQSQDTPVPHAYPELVSPEGARL